MKHFEEYFYNQLCLIKAHRKRQNRPYNNAAIAAEIGCGTSTVACYANGHRKPIQDDDLANIVIYFVNQHIEIHNQAQELDNFYLAATRYVLRKIHLHSIVFGDRVADAYLMGGAITSQFFEHVYVPVNDDLNNA